MLGTAKQGKGEEMESVGSLIVGILSTILLALIGLLFLAFSVAYILLYIADKRGRRIPKDTKLND